MAVANHAHFLPNCSIKLGVCYAVAQQRSQEIGICNHARQTPRVLIDSRFQNEICLRQRIDQPWTIAGNPAVRGAIDQQDEARCADQSGVSERGCDRPIPSRKIGRPPNGASNVKEGLLVPRPNPRQVFKPQRDLFWRWVWRSSPTPSVCVPIHYAHFTPPYRRGLPGVSPPASLRAWRLAWIYQ